MKNLLKKITSSVLLTGMFLTILPASNAMADGKFSDVKTTDPGYAAINSVASLGYFNGYSDGTFKPDNNITKTEALAVITRAAINSSILEDAKSTRNSDKIYSDIPTKQWYTGLISFSKDLGIINSNVEKNSNTFGLNDKITRAEFIEMFVNAFGINKSSESTALKNISFYDIKYNASYKWVAPAAEIMQNKLLYVNGYTQYKFGPSNNITRREVAWILNKFATQKTNFKNVSIDPTYKTNLKSEIVNIAKFENNSDSDNNSNGNTSTGTTNNSGELNLDDLFENPTTTNTGSTSTGSTSTGSTSTNGTGSASIVLSSTDTSKLTIPLGSNGLELGTFTIKAGSSDVEVKRIDFERQGLASTDVVTGLALFDSNGLRLSSVRDDNTNNNQAQINLTTSLKIKAGETAIISLRAIIGTSSTIASSEFSYKIVGIDSTQTISYDNVKTRSFSIAGSSAGTVKIDTNGTVSNPKIGEEKEIAKFKITGDSKDDVLLKSIIVNSNNNDASEDLKNIKLTLDDDSSVLATVASVSNKLIRFNLDTPYKISKGKIAKFTVTAEIADGADHSYSFFIDEGLDVIVINNSFDLPTAVNIDNVDAAGNLGTIKIEAGELTLQSINASNENLKMDKNGITLGQIKVTNVQGKNLELQKFSVKLAVSGSGYLDKDGNGTYNSASGDTLATAKDIFENVQLYDSGSNRVYDLDLISGTTNVYGSNDFNITLPTGSTTFTIMADTLKDVSSFETVKVDMSLKTGDAEYSTNGSFYVEETTNNKEVSDITPSELTFDTLKGLIGKATVSFNPLSDMKIVRGAKDLSLLSFDVKADKFSTLKANDLTVLITASGANATNNEITSVNLYKVSGTTKTLLKSVSGTKLASGKATFTGLADKITAGSTNSYEVDINVIDSNSIVGKDITGVVTTFSIDDEDANSVTVSGLIGQSNRLLTVSSAGSMNIAYDSKSDNNKVNKTLLAGNSYKVVEYKVNAVNEEVDVNKLVFTLAGSTGVNIKKSIESASVYLDGKKVATASNSDINTTDSTISFENIDGFVIPTKEVLFQLEIKTSLIGYEKIGKTLTDLKVTKVDMLEADGKSSGKSVEDKTITQDSSLFTISPVSVTSSVSQSFGSEAKIKITIDSGSNTDTTSNNNVKIDLSQLVFTELGNSGEANAYQLYLEGDSSDIVTATNTGGTVTFDLSLFTNKRISSNETFVIKNKGTVNQTYGLKLRKDGIVYKTTSDNPTAEIKSNESTEKDLGTRTY